MHQTAKPAKTKSPKRKPAAGAIAWARHRIEVEQAAAVICLHTAPDSLHYATYGLEFDRSLGLKDRKPSTRLSSITPRDTAESAVDHALDDCCVAIEQITELMHDPAVSGNGKAAAIAALEALDEEVSGAGVEEVTEALEQACEQARPAEVSPEMPKPPPAQSDGVQAIALDQLVDHPGNPDPTEQEVLAMVDWLTKEAQQEPLTVRRYLMNGVEYYEILAGKTRFAAARMLGWQSLQCRIRTDLTDDTAAARFAMKNNVMRREENPLRKIRWCEHFVNRGIGTVKEAGDVYGWSESHTRSMLGLLKLPPAWLARVESGELAPTVAIRLNPYAEAAPVMAELEKRWKLDWIRRRMQDKEGIAPAIREVVQSITRPIEAGLKHCYGYELGWDHPRYFKLTNTDESVLQIVSLPIGKNGKLQRVALNAKAYDAIQIPIIKEKIAAKQAGGKKPKAGTKAKQLTPAEAKKEAARKRAVAEAKLAKQLREWRHRMLRLGVAETIRERSLGSWEITALLPWAIQACTTLSMAAYSGRTPIAEYTAAAWRLSTPERLIEQGDRWRPSPQVDLLCRTLGSIDVEDDPVSDSERMQRWLLSLILWPRVTEQVQLELATLGGSAIGDELPWSVNIPSLDHAAVETIAGLFDVTWPFLWAWAAEPRSEAREMLRVFVELHNRDQINDLAREICTDRHVQAETKTHGVLCIAEAKTKAAAVDALIAMHTPKIPLKLPSCLSPPAKKTAKKKGS